MASSVGPSTTAMKSNGPVTASRLTTVDGPPLIWVSSFFTDLVLPAAVSMSTYARMRFPVFVMHASSARGRAERRRQRGRERRAALHEPRPLDVHSRAPFVGVVGRIEARDERRARPLDPERQGLAHALVAEARDDQVEPLRVRLAHV